MEETKLPDSILDYDRLEPLESEDVAVSEESVQAAFGEKDKLAHAVYRAARKAKGDTKPLGFAAILDLILKLFSLVGNCPFARASKAMREGDSSVMAAAMRAALQSGFTPAESVAFAIALRDEARVAESSDVESFLMAAPAFVER